MKVEGWIMTDRVGSKECFEVEIDDEDLEGRTQMQRDAYIDDCVREAMWDRMEWGWKPL